jgi:hypothetical protein
LRCLLRCSYPLYTGSHSEGKSKNDNQIKKKEKPQGRLALGSVFRFKADYGCKTT